MKREYLVGLIAAIFPLTVLSESILILDEQKNKENLKVEEDLYTAEQTETPDSTPETKEKEEIPLVEGPAPHLTFHMGLAAEGQNFVGGSIENKGKVSVHGGYIVILPIDEKCNPLTPILHHFGKVKSGEVLPFRVLVQAPLSAYRVIGFNAFDDMGFQIDSVDDTLDIISKRIPAERKACEASRTQVSNS